MQLWEGGHVGGELGSEDWEVESRASRQLAWL